MGEQDHVRGCALSMSIESVRTDDWIVEWASSAVSTKPSPASVASVSVFVGDAGDAGD